MLALSIRQPYAELILRGIKRIEYRTVRTTKIGERFYIYVPRKWAGGNWEPELWQPGAGSRQPGKRSGCGLPHPNGEFGRLPIPACRLPTSVIVGSAVISRCVRGETYHAWHLTDVRRYKRVRKLPAGVQPQPVWFRPYRKAA